MGESLYDKVTTLQNMLLDRATGGVPDDQEYEASRSELLANRRVASRLPSFVRTSRDLSQFWNFIQPKFGTYRERRRYIWDAFAPLLEDLETEVSFPADDLITSSLREFDVASVGEQWRKALERRSTDPEGAITMARTMLESLCKHILDNSGVEYPSDGDLPKLYSLTANVLHLSPTAHTEPVFKQILGGCISVVVGLATLRNRLSDAHGRGARGVHPGPRHAELAVNLAGSLATFLIQTREARAKDSPPA